MFIPPKLPTSIGYSPWTVEKLERKLSGDGINALVITVDETGVCVLATTLGAIERGSRVILVSDVLCSSADPTHDVVAL